MARNEAPIDPDSSEPISASPTPAPPSHAEQLARGRARREGTGWGDVAQLTTDGRDPLGILAEQNATRLQELVPLRIERMSASPFTFYRGTAALMAADLARDPHSGIFVASCGDAHVSNLGFYASPQRTLTFDLNDFDEAAWAPWEWDVKRLVASIVVAGRSTDRDPNVVERAARVAVKAYLHAMSAATETSPTERYFTHYSPSANLETLDRHSREALEAAMKDARKRTRTRAGRRLTERTDDGRVRLKEQPPTTMHVDEELWTRVYDALRQYQESASVDVREVLRQYSLVDLALRVVGVGSVGTRCYIALLQDGDGRNFVLQIKEAGVSVLEQYGGVRQPADLHETVAAFGNGARVVGMQRILQAASDPFLGHLRARADFYVRQFHDMKGGIDMDTLKDAPFHRYAEACGAVLARAHAQSPDAAQIVGFAGKGRRLTDAIVEWSRAYAELSRSDYEAFLAANVAG
jgi:uncharacterized protein (DUF2252 family)